MEKGVWRHGGKSLGPRKYLTAEQPYCSGRSRIVQRVNVSGGVWVRLQRVDVSGGVWVGSCSTSMYTVEDESVRAARRCTWCWRMGDEDESDRAVRRCTTWRMDRILVGSCSGRCTQWRIEARMVEDGRARMQRSMHTVEDGGKDCAAGRCTRDGGAVNSGQGGGGGSL